MTISHSLLHSPAWAIFITVMNDLPAFFCLYTEIKSKIKVRDWCFAWTILCCTYHSAIEQTNAHVPLSFILDPLFHHVQCLVFYISYTTVILVLCKWTQCCSITHFFSFFFLNFFIILGGERGAVTWLPPHSKQDFNSLQNILTSRVILFCKITFLTAKCIAQLMQSSFMFFSKTFLSFSSF